MARLSIHRHFATLKDPRRRRRCRHRLLDIVVIAIRAVIASCNDWQEIELFARARLDWFRRFLPLPHGVPPHDTSERVFDRIDPRASQACFQGWIGTLAACLDVRQIAIGGKTLCGSATRELGPLHLVSAWATARHLGLAQIAVEEGSNEIPAIPKLLELLDLHGALVSIDAAGCQKAIAQQILDGGGDYVLVVKDNRPKRLAAIREHMGAVFDGVVDDYSERRARDRGRGRQELRLYTTRPAPPELRAEWPGLQVIGTCYHERAMQGKTSTEMRYFVGSKAAGARCYGKALRHHWRIENCCHWQMDVTFGEDASRISKRHAAENFALVRRLALSVLKQYPAKQGIKCKRMAACLGPTILEEILRVGAKPEQL
jgi:predicted transposase YbfD/YdcC